MADGTAAFRAVAAAHARCFWLDRAHPRGWPGLGSLVGWLADDDVSLSLDAATGRVFRHASGSSEVVGTDVFAVLEAEMAAGPRDALWVGYLGYASRPDLPARAGAWQPDAVWLRVGPANLVAADVVEPGAAPPTAAEIGPLVDEAWYAAAFDTVQEHLHAGRSYEVNLTYRIAGDAEADP